MSDQEKQNREKIPCDPLFDGHLEITFDQMTIEQKLDWIQQNMMLLNLGRQQREKKALEAARKQDTSG